MKKLKLVIKHTMAEALVQAITELLQHRYDDAEDKLILAGLLEVKQRLQKRMIDYQQHYTFKLTPVQALSLQIMSTDFIPEHNTYLGNFLGLLAMDVDQNLNA